jgi:enoyl-CoA hydratase/carnithine racemase
MDGITVGGEAGITTLTIDRPEKRNALTAAMYTALADALDAAAADAGVRVVVVLGDRAIFTAGNDIAEFLHEPPTGLDSPVMRFLRTIAAFPKPLVAGVCGPAVGVGTTMLLHCDLVFAADDASFSVPFADLGLPPEAASSLLLPRLLGHHRAAALLLLGDRLDAAGALAAGLVNEVVPAAEVDERALAAARRLAAKPLSAVVAAKRLMKQADEDGVLARIDEEAGVFSRMLQEPAAREAFTAFLEKRRPDFAGL